MNAQLIEKPTYTIGERLTLPQYAGWRTLYPIFVDGVNAADGLIAFVGMKAGWGKCWELYYIREAPEGARLHFLRMQPAPERGEYVPSKETATQRLTELVALLPGKFKTAAQLLEAKRTAKAQEITHAMEYLKSLEGALAEAVEEHRILGKLGMGDLTAEDVRTYNKMCSKSLETLNFIRSKIDRQAQAIADRGL